MMVCRSRFLLYVCLVLQLLGLPFYSLAQDTALLSFLCSNNAPFSATQKPHPLFDQAFYKSDFFLFGEIHGSAEPQRTDFDLFTHLHRLAGVWHYLAEVDYTKAWMLNRYLAGGDTLSLDSVFASWRSDTAQWANREHYAKWQQLRQWQQSLPKAQRIRVVGIDVPQDYRLLARHFQALAQGRRWGALQPHADSLLLLAGVAEKKGLVAYAKRLLPLVDAQATEWQKVLGGDFVAFRHLLQVLNWLDAGNTRDRVMWLNYQAQAEAGQFANRPVYGYLGFFHCLQTGYNKTMPFAALLRQQVGQAKRITTLAMQTIDSKTLLPYMGMMRQLMPLSRATQLWAENPALETAANTFPTT